MADMKETEGQAQATETLEANEFDSLLKKDFKARNVKQQERVKEAVATLASQALIGTALVSEDAITTIQAIVAQIDAQLSAQVNEILHHQDFQKLEGTWRGMSHLINNTETDETLKIRVINISKNDLGKTLKKFRGVAWDQSPLFKQIYEAEYGVFGGEPYGCLLGDFHFDHSPQDVKMLEDMSHIAAAAHAPFIAGAAPEICGLDSWQELSKPRDLTKIFATPDYAAWRSLRESEDARYLGMAMPRFLSRLPYGAKTDPVEEFDFEEVTEGGSHSRYTWSNAAYTMAVNINRAFKTSGWCAQIRGVESGGLVEGLPVHTFPSDEGGVDMKCPTEIGITDRREAELSKNGFMALVHKKNADAAAFFAADSIQKPQVYDDPDATSNAALSARLPYIFATCRFAHYLKSIVRDKIGSMKERSDMERWLNNWIMNYVEPDSEAGEKAKARRPLAEAKVEVLEVEGAPGYYSAKFWLRPHFQLEGLKTSLRLVAKLPTGE